MRTERDHTPLGELLLKARLEKKISRAQLSKKVGISENTLVRYEKAGLEDDGQYPQGSKLASLCFELDISPQKALFGCLTEDEYWKASNKVFEEKIENHPSMEWHIEQNMALIKDNYFLRSLLKKLLGPVPVRGSSEEEKVEWMVLQLEGITQREESFERRMEFKGYISLPEVFGVPTPGIEYHHPEDDDRRWIWDYRIKGEIPETEFEWAEPLHREEKPKDDIDLE